MDEADSVRVFDLTVDNKFSLYHRSGEPWVTLEKYDDPEGEGPSVRLILTSQRWLQFIRKLKSLTLTLLAVTRGDALSESANLGAGYFARVRPPLKFVDIRRYHTPRYTTDHLPTREGVTLSRGEWFELVCIVGAINRRLDIEDFTSCSSPRNHTTALQYLLCTGCW
jgi:hypothetical protein